MLLAPVPSHAQNCSVSAPSEPAQSRDIQLDISCPGAPFFKLSESPDYRESTDTGVHVSIDSVDAGGQFADISIRYPNGIPGGSGVPFAVTDTTREVRILAVLFKFSDGALTPPAYATPAWAAKLVFGGGHDGRGLANSIKAHIEQNTYGTVTVTGEVYPAWIHVSPLETYRDLNLTPTPDRRFADEIVQRLVDTDPGFFSGKDFDFLIALTPGGLMATTLRGDHWYPNWPDSRGIFEGWAMYDIPIDSGSELYDTIHDEPRASTTDTVVVPRHNPQSVEGVWLAGDAGHTGINYFTGGSVRYDTSNPNRYAHFVELGTPLPAANTNVIITYYPRASVRLTDAQMALAPPNTMPESVKFGHMIHELYHGMDWLLNPNGEQIGDLYHNPQQLIGPYGLMARGAWNNYTVDDVRYYVPANLSAYSKVKLDIVEPYALRHGKDEISLRLHKAEESDFTGTNDRIKVIKVPLHSTTDVGQQQIVEMYPTTEVTFAGEEYLLLEWRYTGRDLENGAYNFDEALPHSGLVVYHVIEGGSTSRHGDKDSTLVRIVDATPAFSAFPFGDLEAFWAEDVFSLDTSAAPFGDASGVHDRVAAAPWNWKAADSTTTDFQLSNGNGEKTIYAKFMDLNGQVVTETSVLLTLVEADNAPPLADAGTDQWLTDDDGDGLEWVMLDGGGSSDPDGSITGYEWYEAGTLIASGVAPAVGLSVGAHVLTLVVTDDQSATDDDDLLVTVEAANLPPTADAGADASVTDTDGNGVETVTLDGTGSYDPDGSIASYEWYEEGALVTTGASPSVVLGLGSHSLTLTVTDDRGATASDVVAVDVVTGSVAAPSDLSAVVSNKDVGLAWLDNADNEAGFIVERGSKAKGVVQFAPVANVGPNITSYLETLPPGTYYFRVQAVGLGGTMSEHSNVVNVSIKGGGKAGGKGRL